MPKWRNWQTRNVQGVVSARAWGFKSPLRHQGRHSAAFFTGKGRIAGLVRRFAKPLRVLKPFEGSNPSPSAILRWVAQLGRATVSKEAASFVGLPEPIF